MVGAPSWVGERSTSAYSDRFSSLPFASLRRRRDLGEWSVPGGAGGGVPGASVERPDAPYGVGSWISVPESSRESGGSSGGGAAAKSASEFATTRTVPRAWAAATKLRNQSSWSLVRNLNVWTRITVAWFGCWATSQYWRIRASLAPSEMVTCPMPTGEIAEGASTGWYA